VQANRGTLFMDEISNLPLEMQAKLMRVLQEGEVRPLGSRQVYETDVRIIAASSMPLQDLVAENKFREDLYYRLMVYPVSIPVLEERRSDIPLFADHFLKKFSQQQGKKIFSIQKDLLEFLKQRSWPGNIRELENYIERMVTFAPPESEVLQSSILPPGIRDEFKDFLAGQNSSVKQISLSEQLSQYETRLLREALVENDWNQSAAARALNIPEQTLRYKMNKLGIKPRIQPPEGSEPSGG
jgi:transcriptional regulator with PAS, ATPase and Fis domain